MHVQVWVTCGGEALLTMAITDYGCTGYGHTDYGHLRQRGGLECGWVAEEEPVHRREQHLVRVGGRCGLGEAEECGCG